MALSISLAQVHPWHLERLDTLGFVDLAMRSWQLKLHLMDATKRRRAVCDELGCLRHLAGHLTRSNP